MREKRLGLTEVEVPGRLTVAHHQGGLVCSLEQVVSGSREALDALVSKTISGLAEWTLEQGGLIGHIKACLQTPSGTLMYSTTGEELHVRSLPDTGTLLSFTAIVFFVEEEGLRRQLEDFPDSLEKLRS